MPKGIRNPLSNIPQNTNPKAIRKNSHRQARMDSTLYEQAYPDKKLLKIPEDNPEFHWLLQSGAEPVPRKTEKLKVFEGINDKSQNGWVTWPTGTKADGTVQLTYLLMIDPQTYDEMYTIPDEQRMAEIKEAMRLGADQSGLERHLKGGGSIQTYAPNLPVGDGRGFNEIRAR